MKFFAAVLIAAAIATQGVEGLVRPQPNRLLATGVTTAPAVTTTPSVTTATSTTPTATTAATDATSVPAVTTVATDSTNSTSAEGSEETDSSWMIEGSEEGVEASSTSTSSSRSGSGDSAPNVGDESGSSAAVSLQSITFVASAIVATAVTALF